MLAVLSASLFSVFEAHAQDPSTLAPAVGKSSSFPKQSMVGPSRNIDKSQPLYLQGDELIYDTGGNKVIARGNVEIYYNNYILTADQVVYDQSANTLTAVGNVILKEPNGNVVRADRYTLTDDFRDGFVSQLSIVASDDTRIAAERATRRGGNTTVFTNGRFTPCKTTDGMPPLWCLSAATVVHDQAAATISYQDAQFELFGVPILYTPYFEHAGSVGEAQVGLPDAAAHSVATLSATARRSRTTSRWRRTTTSRSTRCTPRARASCGRATGGTAPRMASTTSRAPASIRMPPICRSSIENRDQYNGWRGSVETKGLFNLGSWWKLRLGRDDGVGRRVPALLQDRQRLLTDRVNRIFLAGLSDRNYFELSAYEFTDLGFTTPGTSETKQYAYPIMDYNYVFADPILGGELTWTTNALGLSSNQDPTAFAPFADTNQQMNRVVTELNWRRRLTDPIGITYTPFAQLRGDVYQISNYFDPFDPAAPLQETSFARGLALGGVTVSYPWVANTASGSHVIEPIGQIIGAPGLDQAGRAAERGCPEPRLRRHQPVRGDEVLRLRPHRDRHPRQRRPAVHLPVQRRWLCSYPRRRKLSILPAPTPYADPSFDVNGNPVFTPIAACRRTAPTTCSAPMLRHGRSCSSSPSRASTSPASPLPARMPARS